jgi:hypothetical protein
VSLRARACWNSSVSRAAPVDLVGGVERSARPQRAVHARVEVEELRVRRGRAARAPREHREPDGEEQVLQHLEPPLHHAALDAAVLRDGGHVERRRLTEGRRLEEAGEPGQVARERLLLDLLAEVGADVALEVAARAGLVGGVHGHREAAAGHRRPQVPVPTELRRRQRVHPERDGPTAQQVDAAAPQLARARTRERELQPRADLDQAVDLVEQGRDPLDLVHHHPTGVAGRDPAAQAVRARRQVEEGLAVEQIEPRRPTEPLPQPRRLARAPRAEEEEGLVRKVQQTGVHDSQLSHSWESATPNSVAAGSPSRRDRAPRAQEVRTLVDGDPLGRSGGHRGVEQRRQRCAPRRCEGLLALLVGVERGGAGARDRSRAQHLRDDQEAASRSLQGRGPSRRSTVPAWSSPKCADAVRCSAVSQAFHAAVYTRAAEGSSAATSPWAR